MYFMKINILLYFCVYFNFLSLFSIITLYKIHSSKHNIYYWEILQNSKTRITRNNAEASYININRLFGQISNSNSYLETTKWPS